MAALFAYPLLKYIWQYGSKPTKFVGYNIYSCCQQHISFLLLLQLPAVAAVVCRRASYLSTPRMGAGPAYSGNSIL